MCSKNTKSNADYRQAHRYRVQQLESPPLECLKAPRQMVMVVRQSRVFFCNFFLNVHFRHTTDTQPDQPANEHQSNKQVNNHKVPRNILYNNALNVA